MSREKIWPTKWNENNGIRNKELKLAKTVPRRK